MYPILLRLGSFILYSYTVALVAGITLGTRLAYLRARDYLSRAQDELFAPAIVLDAGFWALLGGIVGARLAYVAANWAYYVDHLGAAADLSEGGLNWHGALIGGTAAVAVWVAVKRRSDPSVPSLRVLLDLAAPGLAWGGALGWLGALLTGSAYGAKASGIGPSWTWSTARLPDIYGVVAPRFVTQPAMIVLCLLLGALLWTTRKRLERRQGLAFALYLGLYAAADLGVWSLRGDGTWRWGLWLWQWVDLAELCVAVGLAITAAGQHRGEP
jgi:phosphatidylglycerol:prolipoprotein diacylglycerol transferase